MTPFTDIYPFALTVISDYRLKTLAQSNYTAFLLKMKEILIKSIPRFTGCMQSLDFDTTTDSFVNTLTLQEQEILGEYMELTWFESVINDISQVNLRVQVRGAKTNSEASNLKEKVKAYNALKEQVGNRVSDYQLLSMGG